MAVDNNSDLLAGGALVSRLSHLCHDYDSVYLVYRTFGGEISVKCTVPVIQYMLFPSFVLTPCFSLLPQWFVPNELALITLAWIYHGLKGSVMVPVCRPGVQSPWRPVVWAGNTMGDTQEHGPRWRASWVLSFIHEFQDCFVPKSFILNSIFHKSS